MCFTCPRVADWSQTVTATSTFIYAMLKYPEVLKKAQEELDRVIEPGHLPTLEDEEFLPYTTAIVKEVLRWKTVLPIGQFLAAPRMFHSS